MIDLCPGERTVPRQTRQAGQRGGDDDEDEKSKAEDEQSQLGWLLAGQTKAVCEVNRTGQAKQMQDFEVGMGRRAGEERSRG